MPHELNAQARRWRDGLGALDPSAWSTGLSDAGARFAWQVACDALTDDALDVAWARGGEPYRAAAFVAARTVFTAPLEWCAVLLGRGTEVRVKHPRGHGGAARALADHARRFGLPLVATDDPDAALGDAELIVAMGSDPTIAAIGAAHPGAALLGFGHRWSLAHVRSAAAFPALADDLALHDGRGCMSPSVVVTALPLGEAVEALAGAMADRARAIPVGAVSAAESVAIRHRAALARVVGVARAGDGWSVHGLPPEHLGAPVAGLPRSIAVIALPDAAAVARWLGPHAATLSTVGTDDPADVDALAAALPATTARWAACGQMQRPPLVRLHDGVDWLSATVRRS